jgi:general secretion pathway protein D
VLIKVVFLEVTHNNTLDIGIEGGFRRGLGNSTTSAVANVFGLSGLGSPAGGATTPLGQPVGSFVPTPPGAGLYQIMSTDYQATLRAIATAGKTEVLSKPSILARNNQPATITVGQSVPLITNVRYDTFGNAINSVQYTDIGIILRVTPFIHPNGMVEMIVAPEISSLTDQTVPISTGVSVPVIAKRAADTVVVTPNGQTVIIGGLMQNNKASNDSKIPFLGDIPVLGNLFKRKGRNDTKTELIIFLTPTIVDGAEQLAGMTTKERDNAQMAPKAFTAEELNRYLDTLPSKDKSDVKSENKKK